MNTSARSAFRISRSAGQAAGRTEIFTDGFNRTESAIAAF